MPPGIVGFPTNPACLLIPVAIVVHPAVQGPCRIPWRPSGSGTRHASFVENHYSNPSGSFMYVCICKGVTESQICEAIERGLCTRKEIANCLKAGTGCGKCGPDIRDLLDRTGAPAEGVGISTRAEMRERKHAESRRHAAVAGRTRRVAHPSGGLGDMGTREASAGLVNS